jgi:hypothetical protein
MIGIWVLFNDGVLELYLGESSEQATNDMHNA